MKTLILAALLSVSLFASYEVRGGIIQGSGTLNLAADGIALESISGSFAGSKIQFGKVVTENDIKNYIYLGYEVAAFTTAGNVYQDKSNAFLFGAEGAMGDKLKFIYGGEFGLGKYDVDGTSISFSTFSAEPFIGLRYDFQNGFFTNARLGYKVIRLNDVNFEGYILNGAIKGSSIGISLGYKY